MNKAHRFIVLPGIIALLLIVGGGLFTFHTANAGAGVLYAAPAAQGSGDCLSWANACTLQSALGMAGSGNEIWVKAGVYYPGAALTDTFTLVTGVALYGGFAGDELTRDERDWQTNPTILSGDIDHNDIDPEVNYVIENYAQIQGSNTYHILTGDNTDPSAILDGFVVTGGQANGSTPYNRGGGMHNYGGSPTLVNVVFTGNYAAANGGGMYTYYGNPSLTNVTFNGNYASGGGGMYNHNNSSVDLTGVTFWNNTAQSGGGVVNDTSSNSVLVDVLFADNTATGNGGALYNYESSPTLTDTHFTGNDAGALGGAVYNHYSDFTLSEATLSGNTAVNDAGGAIYNFGGVSDLTGVEFSANQAVSGGAIFNNYGSHTYTEVTFTGNTAAVNGGGVFGYSADMALTGVTFDGNTASGGGGMFNYGNNDHRFTNVIFSGNTASGNGGGLLQSFGWPVLVNVLFHANTATHNGGGLYMEPENTPVLTNVTFSGNSADYGGGFYNYDEVTVTNAILWGNSAPNGAQFYNIGNPPTITYSIVEGGLAGTGNLDADPLFLNPDANLRLGPGSPAIDAGEITVCPLTDLDGVTRPAGLGCDMGAYEMNDFAVEVSKSASEILIAPYQQIDFTVTVTNAGPGITGGVLMDALPASLLLSGSITLDPPEAGSVSTQPFLAEELTIPANQTVTVTFTVSVDPLIAGTQITNTASFSAPALPDGVSDSVTLTYNSEPSITSTPPLTVAQRNPYTYAITASDPDLLLEDELTITPASLPDWLTLTDNGDNTADLTGTPPEAGDFEVEICVTDLAGAYTIQEFTITVEPRNFIFLPLAVKSSP